MTATEPVPRREAGPGAARGACIGACMVELRERPDGCLPRGYGGDTLNTALYLARLGVAVDAVTAIGDDPWSDAMLAGRVVGHTRGRSSRHPPRVDRSRAESLPA